MMGVESCNGDSYVGDDEAGADSSFFFFKLKTAYEVRISDWSSDVCSSDLHARDERLQHQLLRLARRQPARLEVIEGHCVELADRDRKSVVYGKSVSVRVDRCGRRIIKNNKTFALIRIDLILPYSHDIVT